MGIVLAAACGQATQGYVASAPTTEPVFPEPASAGGWVHDPPESQGVDAARMSDAIAYLLANTPPQGDGVMSS